MHDDLKEKIEEELLTKTGKVNSAILRRDWFRNSNLYQSILQFTSFLDFKNPKFTERIWCIMNDITKHPKCVVCGECSSFLPSAGAGYSKTCNKPSCKSKASVHNAIETKTKKYGAKVSPKTRDSARKRASELNRKGRITLMERYGVDNPSKIDGIHEKKKQTLLNNHGVDHPSKIINLAENRRHKTFDFYQEISPDSIEVEKYTQTTKGCDRVLFRCNECNTSHDFPSETFKWRSRHTETPCPECLPLKGTSNHQNQIISFIMKLVPNEKIVVNDNTILPGRREIDIYLPERRLAIEYDGVYWHSFSESETREEKNLHLWKTLECEKKGIHLIHIFETEWLNSSEIVESRISNLLKSNTERVFARKCKVIEISDDRVRWLLENWHLQGYCQSSIRYALVYEDEIVSLMTFGTPRFANYEFELLRFASKPFTNVIGGANKLFQHFIRENNPSSVVSYANRRWSNSFYSVYEKMGFELKGDSKPGYFYYHKKDGMVLHNRIKFQKHKLPHLLDKFDLQMSESENMFMNGYRRIWDCGNLVFEWSR